MTFTPMLCARLGNPARLSDRRYIAEPWHWLRDRPVSESGRLRRGNGSLVLTILWKLGVIDRSSEPMLASRSA